MVPIGGAVKLIAPLEGYCVHGGRARVKTLEAAGSMRRAVPKLVMTGRMVRLVSEGGLVMWPLASVEVMVGRVSTAGSLLLIEARNAPKSGPTRVENTPYEIRP
jgi:hypothetical protein